MDKLILSFFLNIKKRTDDLDIGRSPEIKKVFKFCATKILAPAISGNMNLSRQTVTGIPTNTDIGNIAKSSGAKFRTDAPGIPSIRSFGIWFVCLVQMRPRSRIFAGQQNYIDNICQFIWF